MTQEEKQLLLLIDLCGRLPYKVKISISSDYTNTLEITTLNCHHLDSTYSMEYRMLRPYLRPMSSMTEEEKKDYQYITERWMYDARYSIGDSIDWLNKKMFDYRGLIEKGLALPAPEGMYK